MNKNSEYMPITTKHTWMEIFLSFSLPLQLASWMHCQESLYQIHYMLEINLDHRAFPDYWFKRFPFGFSAKKRTLIRSPSSSTHNSFWKYMCRMMTHFTKRQAYGPETHSCVQLISQKGVYLLVLNVQMLPNQCACEHTYKERLPSLKNHQPLRWKGFFCPFPCFNSLAITFPLSTTKLKDSNRV